MKKGLYNFVNNFILLLSHKTHGLRYIARHFLWHHPIKKRYDATEMYKVDFESSRSEHVGKSISLF